MSGGRIAIVKNQRANRARAIERDGAIGRKVQRAEVSRCVGATGDESAAPVVTHGPRAAEQIGPDARPCRSGDDERGWRTGDAADDDRVKPGIGQRNTGDVVIAIGGAGDVGSV